MAVENERNDMGRAGVRYFCIHKLDNNCSSWELNTFSVLLGNVAWCQRNLRSVAEPHLCHMCTYSCLKASTCSMVAIPARAKLSLYWLILMDSSHSGTDLNMVPSQPLVLGRRMDTLRGTRHVWITHHLLLRYVLWVHVRMFEQGGTSFTVNMLLTVSRYDSTIYDHLMENTKTNTAMVKEKVGDRSYSNRRWIS